MNELIIIILLSIVFTFLAFIISQFMMKWFKITNAKNKFGILIIAMLTAFSVFSFTIITANSNFENGSTIKKDIETLSEEYSSIIMVVEETDILENNMDSNKNFITNLNCYSSGNLEYSSFSPYYKITTFFPNMLGYQNNILLGIIKQYQNEKTKIINQYNPNEGEIDLSSSFITHIDEKTENTKNDPLYPFFIMNIFLIIFSCLYLIFSFIFGKKLVLKRNNAKECQDPVINKIVQDLLNELKIKKIKVYLYDGDPNAFIFGFPASLALSNNLINCLSRKELISAIRHELAHIKNKDIIIKPILQTMRILFFYNPIVHVIYHKIMKERELMADSLFVNSKEEKITLIEALIKIHKYTNKRKPLYQTIISSCFLSLIPYKSKKLDLKDRYNHLFRKNIRKSFYSTLICLIILISNISMVAIARNVLYDTDNSIIKEELLIEDLDVVDKKDYSDHVKYVFRVFEDYHPEFYKKCVVYYILLDSHNNDLSQRELFDTVKLLLNG